MAITVSWRDADTPLVVSVFPAQRKLAAEVSSAMTTQSALRAAARARSTVSWACLDCLSARSLRLAHALAPSSAVLSIRTPRIRTAGQPWLTGATWPGWPLPQLNAPPST